MTARAFHLPPRLSAKADPSQSPAAEPFFGATHANAMRLASRHRYRWTGGRVSDYWDEVFTTDAMDGFAGRAALDDLSAFIASLGSSRNRRWHSTAVAAEPRHGVQVTGALVELADDPLAEFDGVGAHLSAFEGRKCGPWLRAIALPLQPSAALNQQWEQEPAQRKEERSRDRDSNRGAHACDDAENQGQHRGDGEAQAD